MGFGGLEAPRSSGRSRSRGRGWETAGRPVADRLPRLQPPLRQKVRRPGMKTSITSVPVWAWNPGRKNAMLIDKMLVVLNSNGRSTPAQASMWNSGHLIPRPSRRHRTEGLLPVTRPGEADPALPGAGSKNRADLPAMLGAARMLRRNSARSRSSACHRSSTTSM